MPLVHYAATKVKMMLTGSGRAPKSQMQDAVCRELRLALSHDRLVRVLLEHEQEVAGSYVGRLDTESDEVTVLEPPTPNQGARRVWSDSRGRIWVSEWLSGKGDQELGDWDISRDEPYFGIPIPDAPGKYFYVWLDAPVGYLASLKNYFDSGKAKANGEPRSFEEFVSADDVRQIHFIGKDIIYFHTLFWPAMLKFAGRKTPDNVYVHGFITVSGAKMSKSRGTGLSPVRYLDIGMNPEWLRYYIAAKLNAYVEDIDFNPDDFVARVNSDLVGKYVNIASRCAGFITKRFGGKLAPTLPKVDPAPHAAEFHGTFAKLYAEEDAATAEEIASYTVPAGHEGEDILGWFAATGKKVARAYHAREFGLAMRLIMRPRGLSTAIPVRGRGVSEFQGPGYASSGHVPPFGVPFPIPFRHLTPTPPLPLSRGGRLLLCATAPAFAKPATVRTVVCEPASAGEARSLTRGRPG